MTNQERRYAFDARLQGDSWEKIGRALGYAGATVYRDMEACLLHSPRRVQGIYPCLSRGIEELYGGCVRSFALDCGIHPSTVYSILKGRIGVTDRNARKMALVLHCAPEKLLLREEQNAAV